MKLSKNLQVLVLVIVVILIGSIAYFLGDKHGVESMSIKQVTPNQIAEAMKGDHFYRDYRENTLLVKGTVSSVKQNNNDLVVNFKSNSTFGAVCDFGSSSATIHQGDIITVISEAGSAERQPSAVLLKNCVFP